MKKIFSYMLLALALPFLGSCESDTDSNPVLLQPETFVLNMPAYAGSQVFDLETSETLNLTCSQPDYGFPAHTTYAVQLTLDDAFVEAADDVEANYVSLPTVFTNTQMAVDAREVADAVVSLWDTYHAGEAFPTEPINLGVRLRANLTGSAEQGVCHSNAITLRVKAYKPEALVTVPTTMHLVGSMAASGGDWSRFVPMAQVTGVDGKFYSVIYFQAGAEFKFNPDAEWAGADRGYGQVAFTDEAIANAGLSTADAANPASNVIVGNAGWYTVVVTTKVSGANIDYTVDVRPAEIYLIGAATNGTWGFDDAWKFSVPADADGEFVSPAAAAGGELRMAVSVPGSEWWASEFTLLNGNTIFYREQANIISSWADNVGAEYSVNMAAGKKVYLNFTAGTGRAE